MRKILFVLFLAFGVAFAQLNPIDKYFKDYSQDYKITIVENTMIINTLTDYSEKDVSFILNIFQYYLDDLKVDIQSTKITNIKLNYNGKIIDLNNQFIKDYFSQKAKNKNMLLQKVLAAPQIKSINH